MTSSRASFVNLCRSPAPFTSHRPATSRASRHVVCATAAHKSTAQPDVIGRRPLLAAAAAVAAVGSFAASRRPADAASRPQLFQQYYENTDKIHEELHKVLAINPDDEAAAVAAVNGFRDEANTWVGAYRGTMSVGRKSFAETTAAINAITGHYTSRGANAPLPPKTREQAERKLASAEAALKKEKAKDAVPTPK